MFEKGNILSLADNNEYVVVDQFSDNVYLIDINKNTNFIFGKLENDEIVELTDSNEIEKVVKIFNSNLNKN